MTLLFDVFTLVSDFDYSSFESSLGWPAGSEGFGGA